MREPAQGGREPSPWTQPTPRSISAVAILLLVRLLTGSVVHADTDDGITLLVHHGATPADVVLTWSGGSPAYEIYRSTSAPTVVTAANELSETNDTTWTDVPPPGGVHFYQIRLKSNHPPVLAPIGNKTAPLGQTLTFSVSATDPDSASVILTVTPLPLPAHVTFDGTTGVFSFRPDSGQVGTVNLTFVASDGELTDSETVPITVPASQPGTTTSLTGRILDANSSSSGFTDPVVTATISLLGAGVSAKSNAQGFFTITGIPSGAKRARAANPSGPSAGPASGLLAVVKQGPMLQ